MIIFSTFSPLAFASVSLTEIMYDFPGTEGKGEHDWIEITNNGTESIDISGFLIF